MLHDFYEFSGTLHVFAKHGEPMYSVPGPGRKALCGAKPKLRGQTPYSNVTFATRSTIDKQGGVCKECVKLA